MITQLRIIILTLVCAGAQTQAQDFKQVVMQLQEKYRQMNNMHIVMDVAVFTKTNPADVHYQLQVDIKKEGEKYLYRFGSNDMLMNEKYLIMVNRAEKEIVYTTRDVKNEAAMRKSFKFNIDSILSFYKEPKYLGIQNGITHFQLDERNGDVKTIDLFVWNETGLLESISYEYNTGQVASIRFRVFDTAPRFETLTFDETHYITRANNGMLPASAFKGFNISTPNL
ncbi:MAG TPA: hypothetical protein VGK59_03530 [Ohtaekwangia sp.]